MSSFCSSIYSIVVSFPVSIAFDFLFFLLFLCLNPFFYHRCKKLLFFFSNLFCFFYIFVDTFTIFSVSACLAFSLFLFSQEGIHFCFFSAVFEHSPFFRSLEIQVWMKFDWKSRPWDVGAEDQG